MSDSRREEIVTIVVNKGFVSLGHLAASLEVSESTVRRDLTLLDEDGRLRRTRGGAVYVADEPLMRYSRRESAFVSEKEAIGKAAAALVENDETILIDGGTTTYHFARELVGKPLQIVTNSLPIANLFANSTDTEIILLGGYVYPRLQVSVGPTTIEALKTIHVSKAIMGIAGVSDGELFNANMLLVETDRQVMRAAERVILVADHSKFGRKALCHVGPIDQVDTIVTDSGIENSQREELERRGVDLVVAESTADADAAVPS
jgi:DeoR/GlpR family transcriptional regulator of sugar metabolism